MPSKEQIVCCIIGGSRAASANTPGVHAPQVHFNYVDCVRWLGDLCASKSVDERIFLWRPEAGADDALDNRGHIHLVQARAPRMLTLACLAIRCTRHVHMRDIRSF